MTRLSQNVLVHSTSGASAQRFVPFTVFARIVPDPGLGKRFEFVRSQEEIGNRIEDALETISPAPSTSFEFAKPTKTTPAFANTPARVTINGNIQVASGSIPKAPSGTHAVVSSSKILTGPGSGHAANIVPSTELDTILISLKTTLEASTSLLDIFRIDLAGIIYGKGGRSFP